MEMANLLARYRVSDFAICPKNKSQGTKIYWSIDMINRAKAFLEVLTDSDLLDDFLSYSLISHKGFVFHSTDGVCANICLDNTEVARRYIAANNLDRAARFPCNVDRNEYLVQLHNDTLYPSDERIKFLEFIINDQQG